MSEVVKTVYEQGQQDSKQHLQWKYETVYNILTNIEGVYRQREDSLTPVL